MLLKSTVLVVLSALFSLESAVATNSPILVHVVFRHGDRTADKDTSYPTDPHGNMTYYPVGNGQLTNKGKLRMFNVGRALRRRYHDLLGDVVTPDTVETITSDFNRTKASAELVLAGAFPPKKDQIWNENLPWQPIPYNYVPRDQDNVLLGVLGMAHQAAYKLYHDSPGPQKLFNNYKRIFEKLCNLSGLEFNSMLSAHRLYYCLTMEKENGLKLPGWTERYYPDILEFLVIKNYGFMTGTLELKRLAIGNLLKKIVVDSQAKIAGTLPNDRKLYLYSGHELNVALLLTSLGLFDNQAPNYGSQVIVEVHNIDGVYGIKLLHDANRGKGPRLLTLIGCGSFCPIDQFVSLAQKYFPVSDL